MYDLYYTQGMLYISLINSLLAETSFIFGQTAGCITLTYYHFAQFSTRRTTMFLLLL